MITIGDTVTLTADGASGEYLHEVVLYEWTIDDVIRPEIILSSITHVIEATKTQVSCRVQNDCGNWSQPVTITIRAEIACPIPTIMGILVS